MSKLNLDQLKAKADEELAKLKKMEADKLPMSACNIQEAVYAAAAREVVMAEIMMNPPVPVPAE